MATATKTTDAGNIYLFRHNDPAMWARFTERADAEGLPMAVILRKLVAAYAEGRVDVLKAAR